MRAKKSPVCAEDAERALENREALLGDSRDFRVVGFRVKPFIPKKPQKKAKAKKSPTRTSIEKGEKK